MRGSGFVAEGERGMPVPVLPRQPPVCSACPWGCLSRTLDGNGTLRPHHRAPRSALRAVPLSGGRRRGRPRSSITGRPGVRPPRGDRDCCCWGHGRAHTHPVLAGVMGVLQLWMEGRGGLGTPTCDGGVGWTLNSLR